MQSRGKTYNAIGVLLFWLIWPVLWFLIPLTRRTRVIVVQDGQALRVKNWMSPQQWDLPGGGIKHGESVKDAALREVEEELGVKVSSVRVLHDDVVIRRRFGLLCRIHYVQAALPKSAELKPNWEISDYQWCDIGSLSADLPADVHRAIRD